ncbi:MAG: flagellar protein [Lachnospiraceae bacterium]|nr:flagellar protein [Lachnospiraceae bacterium]
MEVRNCRSCRRLFNYLGGQQVCPECKDKIEKRFFAVKEYIRENPHARMQEIADANEVTVVQLQQWVREERLQFASDSDIAISCEKCGRRIYTGRYCGDCKKNIAQGLTSAFAHAKEEKKKVDNKKGMRFK